MSLTGRLARMEKAAGIADQRTSVLAVRIVTTDEQEREAERQLIAEGYDPNAHGEVAIIRLVGMQQEAPA